MTTRLWPVTAAVHHMFSLTQTEAGQVGAWQTGMTQGTLCLLPGGTLTSGCRRILQFTECLVPMIHGGLNHLPPAPRTPCLCFHCSIFPKCPSRLLPPPPGGISSSCPCYQWASVVLACLACILTIPNICGDPKLSGMLFLWSHLHP